MSCRTIVGLGLCAIAAPTSALAATEFVIIGGYNEALAKAAPTLEVNKECFALSDMASPDQVDQELKNTCFTPKMCSYNYATNYLTRWHNCATDFNEEEPGIIIYSFAEITSSMEVDTVPTYSDDSERWEFRGSYPFSASEVRSIQRRAVRCLPERKVFIGLGIYEMKYWYHHKICDHFYGEIDIEVLPEETKPQLTTANKPQSQINKPESVKPAAANPFQQIPQLYETLSNTPFYWKRN